MRERQETRGSRRHAGSGLGAYRPHGINYGPVAHEEQIPLNTAGNGEAKSADTNVTQTEKGAALPPTVVTRELRTTKPSKW